MVKRSGHPTTDANGGVLSVFRRLFGSRRPGGRAAVRVTAKPTRATTYPSSTAAAAAAATAPVATDKWKTDTTAAPTLPSSPLVHETGDSARPAVSVPGPVASIPAPPREPSENDSDDASASDGEDDAEFKEHHDGDSEKNKTNDGKTTPKKKTKKKSKAKWVTKLLNQVGVVTKDRVHTRKKRKPRQQDTTAGCHEMLRIARDLYPALWAKVFDFLGPLVPSKCCAVVNKASAVAVKLYYTRYCEWPRPRAYLAHKLFSLPFAESGGLLKRVLEMLPAPERVRSSATSRAFQCVADSLPLTLSKREHGAQFLRILSREQIFQRYRKTDVVCCDSADATDAVRLIQILSDDGDDDDENDDDDGSRGASVREIHLRRFHGFESESHLVQLVQALFTDRISLSLECLVFSELNLADEHFRHLARLFYDGRFPVLHTLDLSYNLFSSRFMRDWARSFHEDRFVGLACLDVAGVAMGDEDMERFFACLRHVPQLVTLRISQNFCTLGSLQILANVVMEGCLTKLSDLSCSGISANDRGIHALVEALGYPGATKALRQLDLSGNDLSDGHQSMYALSEALIAGHWPQLTVLNLSFTKPSRHGYELFACALAKCSYPTLRQVHLAGNLLCGDSMETLVAAMQRLALNRLELLNLSDNQMGPLEFELLSNCLSQDCCPRLQTLLLSGNCAKAEGITRFRRFFRSQVSQKLHTLDLSHNAIPPHSLASLADELMKSNCQQLQVLNVSQNLELRSVERFQQLIRSGKCPSLACLQVGYAQSQAEGFAFVRTVKSRMSVEELRRLKQHKFEARMKQIEQENIEKASRDSARCKRQTKLLRERYDYMESVADRALRRRKRVRKSNHLHIHEEIERLKQEKYHKRVCDELARALAASTAA